MSKKVEKNRDYQTEIPEIQKRIVGALGPKMVFLFGSYAWGEPDANSDLDFLVVESGNSDARERRKKQLKLRKKTFELGVPTDFIVYGEQQWEEGLLEKDLFLNKVKQEGLLLYEKD